MVPELFAEGKGFFRVIHERHEPLLTLFGTTINTGPVMIEAEAKIEDLEPTLRAFREAPVGGGVNVRLKPLAPARLSLVSQDTWPGNSSLAVAGGSSS